MIDPGFYDWGPPDDSSYDQGLAANDYAPYANYGSGYDAGAPGQDYPQTPYPQQPYQQPPAANAPRPAYPGWASPNSTTEEEQLTLVFRNGRAPQTVRNYMMDAKVLTDMDPQHFERIPLDEIDLAATEQLNHSHGVDFTVPGAVRD